MGTEFSDIWIKMQNFLVKNTFNINHSLETGDFFLCIVNFINIT